MRAVLLLRELNEQKRMACDMLLNLSSFPVGLHPNWEAALEALRLLELLRSPLSTGEAPNPCRETPSEPRFRTQEAKLKELLKGQVRELRQ